MSPAIQIQLRCRGTGIDDDFPLLGAIYGPVQLVVQIAELIAHEHILTMIPGQISFRKMAGTTVAMSGVILRHNNLTPGPIGSRPYIDLTMLPCGIADSCLFDPLPVTQLADRQRRRRGFDVHGTGQRIVKG